MSEKKIHSLKPKAPFERIIFIIVLILSIGFWYMVLYSPINEDGDTYTILSSDPTYANITKIELNYNAQVASVDIYLNDQIDSGVLFTSTWHHAWVDWGDDVGSIEISYTPELSSDNTTLIITVDDSYESGFSYFDTSVINEFTFDIYINPNYLIDLNADTSSAPIDVYADNVQFDSITMDQEYSSLDLMFSSVSVNHDILLTGSSGFVDLDFDKVNISGDLSISREYSSISLEYTDLSVENITFSSDSGYIDVEGTNLISESFNTRQESASTRLNMDTVQISDEFNLWGESGYADVYLQSAVIQSDITIVRSSSSISMDLRDSSFGNVSLLTFSGYIDVDAENSIFESIYTEQDTASTSMVLDNVTIQNGFDLVGNSGYADLNVMNSVIGCDMNIYRTSASISLEFESLTFSKDVNITATTISSYIDINWNQHFDAMGANVTTSLESTSGSIDVELSIPTSLIRYDFSGTSDSGNIYFDSDTENYQELSENHFQSDNYSNHALDLITFIAETAHSSIDYNVYENLAD
ncbi:hypothetical protein NEF87_002981 [Candidatus Lokiarchaeum ossiferum]|uniref:Adhesin domain-containing protein n=1 Tax=Candidatus Lokiarchaeum ossiferum TaxID=2951803 RepID=A0ABY6HVU3_9ARCH|nr:hypothetical protein NEF87_002981 [Candidatus Lokiarchaeum sp. B-35]